MAREHSVCSATMISQPSRANSPELHFFMVAIAISAVKFVRMNCQCLASANDRLNSNKQLRFPRVNTELQKWRPLPRLR
jgi:hypothetical protein